MNQTTYHGAIVIFFRNAPHGKQFLVVENAKTGNITFISGAQEGEENLQETAQREALEELGLKPDAYQLIPTDVYQTFIFDERKKERAGAHGSYQVFFADVTHLAEITHTEELRQLWWKSAEETIDSLSFADLKEIFQEALGTQDRGESV